MVYFNLQSHERAQYQRHTGLYNAVHRFHKPLCIIITLPHHKHPVLHPTPQNAPIQSTPSSDILEHHILPRVRGLQL